MNIHEIAKKAVAMPDRSGFSSAPNVSFRHSNNVGIFLKSFFEKLNRRRARYCVLHGYEGLPDYAPSDVDMAVASEHLQLAEDMIFETARNLEFRVVQKLYYDIPRCFYYVVAFRDENGHPGVIQIDILNDDPGIGRYLLPTETLLTRTREFKGFRIPSSPVEACYLLIKKIVKGVWLPEHEKKFRIILRDDSPAARAFMKQIFGNNGMTVIDKLLDETDRKRKNFFLQELRRILFLRYTLLKPRRTIVQAIWLVKRILERLAEPTGLVVVLVAPDGGGKSTIADHLLQRLGFAFRNITRMHWRPYLLPPPRKLLRPGTWYEPETPNHTPHDSQANGKLNSLIRFGYYAMDYLMGFLPKILWPKIRTHLVMIERYYYDFLIDRKRYRLDIPDFLPELVMHLIPHPDLIFLLSGSPETIHARKQEISLDEISRQLVVIESLAVRIPNAHFIDIDQPLESEVTQIEDIILKTLQSRLLKQRGHR
ncbi:MAG: hypothetical protein KBA28_01890 [Syntrophaceae bacterium]|jgi:hypothetical protein|nr:hypothetical protein [Syntrophaceae bacterium]HQP24966.1 hypothetical protein [Smithellaceae bacterium]